MRKFLDTLYKLGGVCAALCIVLITLIVVIQVSFNLIDKSFSIFTGKAIGLTIPSYADFTGYLLAAASFLALAYTLKIGGHIRVTLVTSLLSGVWKKMVDIFALSVGFFIAAYASFYMILLVKDSFDFGDSSSGMIAVPIWIPQTSLALGLLLLTIALFDDLLNLVIFNRQPLYFAKDNHLLSE